MVDECKQSTTPSTTHVKINIQVNTFQSGLKAWMDLYRHCICPASYLNYEFSIYQAKLCQSNRGIRSRWWHYLICIITHGLCSYNARLLNDNVTAIEVSYWWRREFPNYARLHRGRMHRSFTWKLITCRSWVTLIYSLRSPSPRTPVAFAAWVIKNNTITHCHEYFI